MRALSLGFKSYFKATYPLSVRKSEIKQLNDSILRLKKGSYIVVTGEKGNGKTCLINTTLNRHHHGAVKISTKSGASKSVIVDQALRALTRIHFDFFKPVGSAHRLLFFYSFLFKRSPVVVIKVPERLSGQKYADLTAAVRELADDYGLTVVVDGLPNSIPPELIATKRETVIAVEPMSKDQIESISELKGLIDFLKTHNLNEPVWKVLGGSPVDYLKLEGGTTDNKSLSDTEVANQVKKHLHSLLADALHTIVKSSSTTEQIIKIFREKKIIMIPMAELIAETGFLLDYPNQVFREMHTMEDSYIVPSSPALSLIISENINNDAGVSELRDKLFIKAT
eukprot:gene61406-81850_t